MYFICTREKVVEVNVSKILITFLLTSLTAYYLSSIAQSSEFISIFSGFFFGIISSLIVAFLIVSRPLYSRDSLSEIISAIINNDWGFTESFFNSFMGWYENNIVLKKRVFPMSRYPVYFEILLLGNAYYSCQKPRNLNIDNCEKALERASSVSGSVLQEFNIQIDDLTSVIHLNSRYHRYYGMNSLKIIQCKNINQDLLLLNEFSYRSLTQITNNHLTADFVKQCENLKKLISFEEGDSKESALLTLLDSFLNLYSESRKNEDLYLLTLHTLVQIKNVLFFSKNFEQANENDLNKILLDHNFSDINDLNNFLSASHSHHPLFSILLLSAKQNAALVFDEIIKDLGYLVKSHPDIVNISILNLLSTRIKQADLRGFMTDFEKLLPYFSKDSTDAKYYLGAFQICYLLFNLFHAPKSAESVINELLKMLSTEKDIHIQTSIVSNICTIINGSNNLEMMEQVHEYLKANSSDFLIRKFFDWNNFIKEKRAEFGPNFSLHHLPLWYPVQIMIDTQIPPRVTRERFGLFLSRIHGNL